MTMQYSPEHHSSHHTVTDKCFLVFVCTAFAKIILLHQSITLTLPTSTPANKNDDIGVQLKCKVKFGTADIGHPTYLDNADDNMMV